MEEDEYAIVSKKEFMALKKELDNLKKNPLEGSESGENLQASIDNLNKSLNVMLEVFKQAADDMKLEEHDSETVVKQIGPITDKIDTLIDQNQKIAKGIVAIADMVKEKLEEIERASSKRLPPLEGGPAPRPAPMGPPSFGPVPQQPNFGGPSMPEGFDDFGSGMGGLPPLSPPGMPQGPPQGMSPMGQPMGPPQSMSRKPTILGGLMK